MSMTEAMPVETFLDAIGRGTVSQKTTTLPSGKKETTNIVTTVNHKSLDFSNAPNRFTNPDSPYGAEDFRKFHQTCIYVMDYEGAYTRNRQTGLSALSSAVSPTTYLISANLPETVDYSISSNWSDMLPDFTRNATFNTFAQVVLNKFSDSVSSGVNRLSTFKIWNGSEPLSMSLRIPVLDDGDSSTPNSNAQYTNLAEALELLGMFTLPQFTKDGLGFYKPPPSPFSVKVDWQGTTYSLDNATPGRIAVQLGGIMLIDHCVITRVSVNYPNTKALIKHTYTDELAPGVKGTSYLAPILANVTIDISTTEALTADNYSRMLWLRSQSGQGQAEINTSGIAGLASDVGNTAKEVGGFLNTVFTKDKQPT